MSPVLGHSRRHVPKNACIPVSEHKRAREPQTREMGLKIWESNSPSHLVVRDGKWKPLGYSFERTHLWLSTNHQYRCHSLWSFPSTLLLVHCFRVTFLVLSFHVKYSDNNQYSIHSHSVLIIFSFVWSRTIFQNTQKAHATQYPK